ncbi:MAG: glutamine--fructose-6-phosphate transaminase (isomerizing) [Alphaproteobacteria bacterium]|nr:MAG: glutamine--fructose-6-phosphate transaminase (isomerizing) [Alphaproteobacteria bacterium]
MCGIIGFANRHKSIKIQEIIRLLKFLEYRGYDSSGIGFINEEKHLETIRATGPIQSLSSKIQKIQKETNFAIAHTRWATHGGISELNAHPHSLECVSVVHNGIVENYQDIKRQLIEEGAEFKTETDTEVITQLIYSLLKQDIAPLDIVKNLHKTLKGAYALVILFSDGRLIATRNQSPLIFAGSDEEVWVASDIMPLTDKPIAYLQNFEILEYHEKLTLYDKDGIKIEPQFSTISADMIKPTKGKYEHFMLKEIYEQPSVLKKLETYLKNTEIDIQKPNRILIVGCGSSYHAGLLGKQFIESIADIFVCVEIASEFQHSNMPLKDFDLCIFISQSGETFDILASYEIIKKHNIKTIGIINVLHSTLARCVDLIIPLCAGPEIGVASTKAFSAQVAILYYLANLFHKKKDVPSFSSFLKAGLSCAHTVEQFSLNLIHFKNIFFIGRHLQFPLSLEAALKLKEISYLNAQAYAGGELKHGPLALIDTDSLVVALVPKGDIYAQTYSNVQETLARGAHVLIITDNEDVIVEHENAHVLIVPHIPDENLMAFSFIPAIQLLAYYSALKLGCSIDKPRNLAKSVTVA